MVRCDHSHKTHCSTCSCHNLSIAGATDPDPLVQLPSSPPLPMNPDTTDQQHSSPTPSPSHPPLQERASIRDEILMTVVSCLMHRRNCQIPNCPCRSLQDRYRKLFHQNPSYVPHKHAAETCKRECGPNADPRERKHQLHLTLSSQNLNKETHPHTISKHTQPVSYTHLTLPTKA